MHHHVGKEDLGKWGLKTANQSWMTTMDSFFSVKLEGLYPDNGGYNYFRVSPMGTSAIRLGIRYKWLSEHKKDE
jgi:hypothetical protein